MKTKIELSSQVVDFVQSLAPEPRRRLEEALKKLVASKGDIRSLEGGYAGFHRLRVGSHRVIFAIRAARGQRTMDCIYANHRSIVYELFAHILEKISQ